MTFLNIMYKIIAIIIIAVLFSGVVLASCLKNQNTAMPDLNKAWNYYKANFISDDGRVVEAEKNSRTVSEGQSYALLRSVMINDKETFDRVYNWTTNNLKRKNDNLYAWLWGQRKDGSWGVIDANSATDADIDTAFSLICASYLWNDDKYLEDAKKIISDIWNLETKEIKGQRILSSGVCQTQNKILKINPSYFAPYAFRFFAQYDKEHNWQELVDSSYNILEKTESLAASGLPPNWVYMDSVTGKLYIDKNSVESDFSYDAIRTFIRVYIDSIVFKDDRANKFVKKIKFFVKTWQENKEFLVNYKYNGELRDRDKFIGGIAVLLPVIESIDKETASEIYNKEINSKYNNEGFWQDNKNYYAQNLVWMGIWFYFNEYKAREYIEKLYRSWECQKRQKTETENILLNRAGVGNNLYRMAGS